MTEPLKKSSQKWKICLHLFCRRSSSLSVRSLLHYSEVKRVFQICLHLSSAVQFPLLLQFLAHIWAGLTLFAEAYLDLGFSSRCLHHWHTGGNDSDALEGVFFCCCWRLPLSSHVRSWRFWGDTNLLVRSQHSICFTEGFRTFCSGPGPGTVSQSFPLPFSFISRCNYCNALRLGATLEDQSEATAATHCGFPLARNCSPQATCHNNSFNTLYRFPFLMFKVAFIWISRDMGKLAPLC